MKIKQNVSMYNVPMDNIVWLWVWKTIGNFLALLLLLNVAWKVFCRIYDLGPKMVTIFAGQVSIPL